MNHHEGRDRYQFQPWYIKAYRWLRYKPYWMWCGWTMIFAWLRGGAQVHRPWRSRRELAAHLWTINLSMADIEMGHLYTLEEVKHEVDG